MDIGNLRETESRLKQILESIELVNKCSNVLEINVKSAIDDTTKQIIQYKNKPLNEKTTQEIIDWIYGLEDNYFKDWIPILKKSFEKYKVNGANIATVDRQLLLTVFGITDLTVASTLAQHIQSIASNVNIAKNNNDNQEGK